MSSSVTVEPLVMSIQLLMMGIKELKLGLEQHAALKIEGGETCKVDYVVTNEVGEKIGIRNAGEGKVEFIPEKPKSKTTCATIDKMKQSYARLKILDEVKKKGYQNVKEEKLPNGSIRIVVQRWR